MDFHLDQNLVLMNILLATSTPALSYAEASRKYQRKGPSGEQEEMGVSNHNCQLCFCYARYAHVREAACSCCKESPDSVQRVCAPAVWLPARGTMGCGSGVAGGVL